MSTAAIDTQEATGRLRDAGFDEEQAETDVWVMVGSHENLTA